MKTILVTGSGGLIGSEAVRYYHNKGFEVLGIDNNSREKFFGKTASTLPTVELLRKLPGYRHFDLDIANYSAIESLFTSISQIDLIIHTAGQPSHDWAADNTFEDFNANAVGTLNLLQAFRNFHPDAVFIFTSTNKVYGDRPNFLEYVETETRFTPTDRTYANFGISENMSIDNCKHSLFGVSKVYGDLLTQEYGKYFGLKTGTFRGGCLTGENHKGVQAHGFLSYLSFCLNNSIEYKIYGYKGKQVRDNIHSLDVITAFDEFFKNPKSGEVYNIGGSLYSNCSILEAIYLLEEKSGKKLNYTLVDNVREGDHRWYISDMRKFKEHYPSWKHTYSISDIIDRLL